MTFKLGKKSNRELRGVHPMLVHVVEKAIAITPVDFSVHDGNRTKAEQKLYVGLDVSKTMESKHLPQADGWGHAVDLVPYINGRLRWEWPPIFEIAGAMRIAAEEEGVRLRWGGCWRELTGTDDSPEKMWLDYHDRCRVAGRKPFADGPHFELYGLALD